MRVLCTLERLSTCHHFLATWSSCVSEVILPDALLWIVTSQWYRHYLLKCVADDHEQGVVTALPALMTHVSLAYSNIITAVQICKRISFRAAQALLVCHCIVVFTRAPLQGCWQYYWGAISEPCRRQFCLLQANVAVVEEAAPATSAETKSAIMDLPSCKDNDNLLRIRHSVSNHYHPSLGLFTGLQCCILAALSNLEHSCWHSLMKAWTPYPVRNAMRSKLLSAECLHRSRDSLKVDRPCYAYMRDPLMTQNSGILITPKTLTCWIHFQADCQTQVQT